MLSQNKNHTQIKMKVSLVHVEMLHAGIYTGIYTWYISYISARYQAIYYTVYFTYRRYPENRIKYSIMYLIF